MRAQTFYWFDYETFGTSPAWDRPVQFAGQRTDADLNPIDEPATFWCRPPDDYLPHPAACRVTGISPEQAVRDGEPEASFIRRVAAELGRPGTVSVGYNSVRFDDEFTRYTLFRNLEDPYAQEWRDGNSRWDLLDVVRLTRALRPEGIEWPVHEDGRASNRLEHLAAANGIEHGRAHDALSDVEATLGVARLIKSRQPRLFDWAFERRTKAAAGELLNVRERPVLLLAAGTIGADRHHLAPVVPIARHPDNRNGVIVLDLLTDPEELEGLDAQTLQQRVFGQIAVDGRDAMRDSGTQGGDVGEPPLRIGLRTVQLNKCPALAPLATLRPADAERLGIDPVELGARRDRLIQLLVEPAALERIVTAMRREWPERCDDVDGSLYSGAFLDTADRRRLSAIRTAPPERIASLAHGFDDPRLDEMVWRYRARNFPETLDVAEQNRWREQVAARLSDERAPWLDWKGFEAALTEADWREAERPLRDSLEHYARTLGERVGRPNH